LDHKPLSREFLLRQGFCCNGDCINCPYKEKKMKQGKRNNQNKDSSNFAAFGFIGVFTIIITLIVFIIIAKEIPVDTKDMHGPPHNYWVPDTIFINEDSKEIEDWTGTTQDDMSDIDMDCGNDILILNQVNYDSIPKYRIFTDVPAGTDTIIIVDEILYKMNNNKTAWTPVYPDEL